MYHRTRALHTAEILNTHSHVHVKLLLVSKIYVLQCDIFNLCSTDPNKLITITELLNHSEIVGMGPKKTTSDCGDSSQVLHRVATRPGGGVRLSSQTRQVKLGLCFHPLLEADLSYRC